MHVEQYSLITHLHCPTLLCCAGCKLSHRLLGCFEMLWSGPPRCLHAQWNPWNIEADEICWKSSTFSNNKKKGPFRGKRKEGQNVIHHLEGKNCYHSQKLQRHHKWSIKSRVYIFHLDFLKFFPQWYVVYVKRLLYAYIKYLVFIICICRSMLKYL